MLPLVVRGRTAAVDMVAAAGWAIALGVATGALATAAGVPDPRGLVAGALVAGRLPSSRVRCDHGPDPARRTGRATLAVVAPRAHDRTMPRAMSVLRNLERTIAGLVEGTFGRVFRSEVRPVEVARKLAREMDEHKTVSVSRTYVPNEYVVWLSPQRPRANFEEVEHELTDELGAYLLEHARRERYALVSRPSIAFRTDERLSLGEFGIQARLVRQRAAAQDEPSPAEHGHTMVYSTADRIRGPVEETSPRRPARAVLVAGRRAPRARAARRHDRPQPRVRRRARGPQRVAPPRRGPRRARRDMDGRTTSARRTACASTAAPSAGSGETLRAGDAIELGTAEVVFELE